MNGHSAHSPAPSLAFRVLGPLEVDGSDGVQLDVGGGKPATVLALLLLHRNAWVSTEQLVDAVWAGLDVPASAQNNLKTYVWQLRRALPDDRIESRPGAYRVRVESGELDADVASALCDEARALVSRGAAAEAVAVVQQALELWRGRPYDGLTDDAASAVDRLTELHRSLREDLADAHLALGRPSEAIAVLRVLTDEEPLRELAWSRLMAAYRQVGRRHDALAAFQRARTALVRDLGIEPGHELAALHQEILNEDAPRPVVAPVSSNLPPRLTTFVGRAPELHALRGATGVVTIDGMPGIGKTAFAVEAAALSGHEVQQYVDVRTAAVAPTGVGLLILDNVEHADQVQPLLPNNPEALVLVLSRARLAGLDRTTAITLAPLAPAEARELADVPQILAAAGGHPGAIRHLVERLRNRQPWTVTRLTAQLEHQSGRCQALADLLTRFDPAYQALPTPAANLYRRCSPLTHFDLTQAAHLAAVPPNQVEPLIDHLLDLNLLSEPAPGLFTLLPIARDHAHHLHHSTTSQPKPELVA
ncbi:AfsR/SARP family transcriptional regulator [Kribbella sandramycini]|uniref:AfsR/SARP family transcriptional regulator n=1 Tax=Kribbella sandramycini TaxID=60450 RepID=A0A7Y4L4L2_9ACTN|nr:AfsR/SARP family transcriptional regulator [Kribbella sandramycini]MBB6566239.1 DNA-binding SARP family transcriptional activator [Kribbella sandramycini]NOL43096.1 AfsR/SARP family transcriptional regulator [Kribbella sandramycini]